MTQLSLKRAQPALIAIVGFALLRAVWPAPPGVIIQGVILGSLTALLAFGVSLIYRSNRIINFAQADLGVVPAALAVALMSRRQLDLKTYQYVDKSWPYWIVVPIALALAVGLGFFIERFLIRRFGSAPRLILMVVTIGLAQVLAGLATAIPAWVNPGQALAVVSGNSFIRPPFHLTFRIGSVIFNANHVLAAGFVVVASVSLFAFLRFTPIGVAIRACAERADRASLLGINVGLTQSVVWAIAALLSTLTVLLRAGIVGLPLGSAFGPSILVRALAAAVLARMESYAVMFFASAGLGVVEASILWNHRGGSLVDPVLFGVLLVTLLLQRRRKESRVEDSDTSSWRDVASVRPIPRELVGLPEVRFVLAGLGIALAALVVGLPFVLSPARTNLVAATFIYAIVAISLVVLTGWAGEISLGQVAFFAIGAATAGTLNYHYRLDLTVTTLIAGVVGAIASVIVGLPALRIRGLFLAVTSLGFAITTSSFLLDRDYFRFLPDPGSQFVERFPLLGTLDISSERTFYFVCLGALVMALWTARGLRRTRTARILVATHENPRAAQAFGIHLERTKLLAFAISGFYAAFAGGLLVIHQRALGEQLFQPVESLKALTMVVIGGLGSLPGAVLGALFIKSTEWFNTIVPQEFRLLFTTASTGVGLIVVLNNFPEGLGGLLYGLRDRWLRGIADRRKILVPSLHADKRAVDDKAAPSHHRVYERPGPRWLRPSRQAPPPSGYYSYPDLGSASDAALLSVRGLNVSYGQVQVLFDVNIEIARGHVVALLGTNGAGKSTVLKAVSVLVTPDAGAITFDGQDISGMAPHRVAELGVMQMPGGKSVFPSLTVAENLQLAGWLHRKDAARIDAATREVLELFPILAERIDAAAGTLSGGQQQMLGLGMALLVEPKLLMIDELSLGLAPVIVEQLLHVLRELCRRGTTVVLVEQSVNVALTVADTAYFLEKGEVRFFGPTADLLERPDILRSVFLEGTASRHAPSARTQARDTGRSVSTDGPAGVLLEVTGLSKRFSGVAALTDVSLQLHEREILGIIGPNGAGKTTLFDVISGFITPDTGGIAFAGADVTGMSPVDRARIGLARSFQDARLFGGLTVHQAIMLALDSELAVRDPVAGMLTLPAVDVAERGLAGRADELIEFTGLGAFRDKFVAELSTGSRRIVDLACQMGLRPKVILFDEPSSGIAQREAEALGPLLQRIRADLDAALLVIEHDMPLLTSISDRLVALDLGRVIATGAIDDVMHHPQVVASYLGTSREVVERSGTTKALVAAP